MAGEVLMTISRDEVERARLTSELKFVADQATAVYEAREEGLQEGLERGRREPSGKPSGEPPGTSRLWGCCRWSKLRRRLASVPKKSTHCSKQ